MNAWTATLCPACGSDDYGFVDIAWPFGLPEHNPNPSVSWVVGVCCACEYTTDSEDKAATR